MFTQADVKLIKKTAGDSQKLCKSELNAFKSPQSLLAAFPNVMMKRDLNSSCTSPCLSDDVLLHRCSVGHQSSAGPAEEEVN